jgi:hypothetical protein
MAPGGGGDAGGVGGAEAVEPPPLQVMSTREIPRSPVMRTRGNHLAMKTKRQGPRFRYDAFRDEIISDLLYDLAAESTRKALLGNWT